MLTIQNIFAYLQPSIFKISLFYSDQSICFCLFVSPFFLPFFSSLFFSFLFFSFSFFLHFSPSRFPYLHSPSFSSSSASCSSPSSSPSSSCYARPTAFILIFLLKLASHWSVPMRVDVDDVEIWAKIRRNPLPHELWVTCVTSRILLISAHERKDVSPPLVADGGGGGGGGE